MEDSRFRPEQLAELADTLADCLNPDGNCAGGDRARRRGLTLGPQGADGMSELRGRLTPEARAPWRPYRLRCPGYVQSSRRGLSDWFSTDRCGHCRSAR